MHNWLPIVINLLMAVLVIVSLLIVLLVLMQRPKNEGLGAAFGGGMTETLFGGDTTNVLQKVTRYLGVLFFALTLGLSWLYVQKGRGDHSLHKSLSAPTVIPATPAPATPTTDDKIELPAATPAPGEAAVPTPAMPEAASDAVKPEPTPPAPAPESTPATPAPAPPEKP